MAANEDRIGKRSYELWEQEGRPLGERHAILAAGVQEIAASAEADGGAVKNSRAKKPGPESRNCLAKSKPARKARGGAQIAPTTTPSPSAAKITTGVTKHCGKHRRAVWVSEETGRDRPRPAGTGSRKSLAQSGLTFSAFDLPVFRS